MHFGTRSRGTETAVHRMGGAKWQNPNYCFTNEPHLESLYCWIYICETYISILHEGLANHSGSIGTENYALKAQRPGEIMRAPNAMHCQQYVEQDCTTCVCMCVYGGGGGVLQLACNISDYTYC